MKTSRKIRIVAICGSLSSKSYTRAALKIALEGASRDGVSTELIDLREYELNFCTGNDKDLTEDARKLKKQVQSAHGIILGTPEYHGGVSGILKNALDLMGFDEFEGKMIGLLGVSAGQMGAQDALNSLRNVGRVLHGWVVPLQVAIAQVQNEFDSKGKLTNAKIRDRLLALGASVAKFASLHNTEHASAFLKAWEEAVPNPGA